LDAIAEAVPGPVDLIGYSMGARIALHYAVRCPERVGRLVLESGSPGLATPGERAERRAADDALARRIVTRGVAAFLDQWRTMEVLKPGPYRAPSDEARVDRVRAANRPEGLAGALRGLGTGALPSLWDRLREVGLPTLLLAGARDRKFVAIAHRMATGMPAATVVVVPDAGHTVHLDRPDAWLTAVLHHLART
jgi:2-succinyl-6-hydroxy-2,4-cyclohexadiene-1-carboxylate synthase